MKGESMTREEAWRRTKGYLYDVLSGEEADEIIKALEPKTGHWIAQNIYNCHTDFKCSECVYIHSFMHLYGKPTADYTYCPKCGANMSENPTGLESEVSNENCNTCGQKCAIKYHGCSNWIPSAEPYKGMTNGEVVKAVFGFKPRKNTCIIPKLFCNGNPAECDGCKYNDWWNSPYEPQVVEGEKNVQIDKQTLWDRAGTSNHITRADINVRPPKNNSGTQALNEGYAPIADEYKTIN
jgi:hypothetical protein